MAIPRKVVPSIVTASEYDNECTLTDSPSGYDPTSKGASGSKSSFVSGLTQSSGSNVATVSSFVFERSTLSEIHDHKIHMMRLPSKTPPLHPEQMSPHLLLRNLTAGALIDNIKYIGMLKWLMTRGDDPSSYGRASSPHREFTHSL